MTSANQAPNRTAETPAAVIAQRSASFRSCHNGSTSAQPSAGSRKMAVVLLSIISVKSTPIHAEAHTGLRSLGSLTARFSAPSVSVVISGSRIANRLKQ